MTQKFWKKRTTKDKNGENPPHSEVTKAILVHCNLCNNYNNYQQKNENKCEKKIK